MSVRQQMKLSRIYMSDKHRRLFLSLGAIFLVSALAIVYRAKNPIPYTFSFNTWLDDQNTCVLSYTLLSGSQILAKREPSETGLEGLRSESKFQSAPRPTRLKIVWKNLLNGQTYKDDIDLSTLLLLLNFSRPTLFVEPKGSHISIFMITRDSRPKDVSPIGPPEYDTQVVKKVYSN
jgi:hypothetical protein